LRAARSLPNLPDIATVARVRTKNISADTDNVIGCCDKISGERTQGRIVAAGGVLIERINTDGRVVGADSVGT
jgi:hypothetical protein